MASLLVQLASVTAELSSLVSLVDNTVRACPAVERSVF